MILTEGLNLQKFSGNIKFIRVKGWNFIRGVNAKFKTIEGLGIVMRNLGVYVYNLEDNEKWSLAFFLSFLIVGGCCEISKFEG